MSRWPQGQSGKTLYYTNSLKISKNRALEQDTIIPQYIKYKKHYILKALYSQSANFPQPCIPRVGKHATDNIPHNNLIH